MFTSIGEQTLLPTPAETIQLLTSDQFTLGLTEGLLLKKNMYIYFLLFNLSLDYDLVDRE